MQAQKRSEAARVEVTAVSSNAYICVYRRRLPTQREFIETRAAAEGDPLLKKFLNEYLDENRYFDWGDDPSFFAASAILGDVRRASWGVCRPDVRSRLRPGDFVCFFCARPDLHERRTSDYFFIGVGTVAEAIDRRQLFHRRRLAAYRRFYNVLAAPDGRGFRQTEIFRPFHENWRDRLTAYIIFDANPSLTYFNVRHPLWVARYSGAIPERWRSRQDPTVARLEQLLFADRGVFRRLKTSLIRYSHPPINLSSPPSPLGLMRLRAELIAIARSARPSEVGVRHAKVAGRGARLARRPPRG